MENVRFTTPIQQLYNNPSHEGGSHILGHFDTGNACGRKENLQFDRIGKDKRITLVRIHSTSTLNNDSQSTSLPPLIFLIKVSPLPSHVHTTIIQEHLKAFTKKKLIIIIGSHIPRCLCRAINVIKTRLWICHDF